MSDLGDISMVKIENWEESPEGPPPARQNACANGVWGREKREDMAK